MSLLSGCSSLSDRDDDLTVNPADMMPAKKVEIIINGSLNYIVDYPERPCVDDNIVNLIPGEKLFIEAELDGKKLVNLKRVERIVRRDRTLVFEFNQKKDPKALAMYLLIKNPFEHTLKYSAEIQPYGKEEFFKTATAPILPKKYVYEVWLEPVLRILLENFELTD